MNQPTYGSPHFNRPFIRFTNKLPENLESILKTYPELWKISTKFAWVNTYLLQLPLVEEQTAHQYSP